VNVNPLSQTDYRLLIFSLRGHGFALPAEGVQEIVPMSLLSQPPGLPSILEGFLNLRGAAVSVLRLDRLFGLPEQTPGLYTPLVVLRDPDVRLALMVEEVSEVLSLSEEALLPVQEADVFNGCVEAEAALNGRVVHLLSPGRLLLEGERRRIAEFQAVAQRRLREVEASGP
jgi:purine-binding chemotaxis protein CheW